MYIGVRPVPAGRQALHQPQHNTPQHPHGRKTDVPSTANVASPWASTHFPFTYAWSRSSPGSSKNSLALCPVAACVESEAGRLLPVAAAMLLRLRRWWPRPAATRVEARRRRAWARGVKKGVVLGAAAAAAETAQRRYMLWGCGLCVVDRDLGLIETEQEGNWETQHVCRAGAGRQEGTLWIADATAAAAGLLYWAFNTQDNQPAQEPAHHRPID